MLQKLVLAIAVFAIVLVALTFGETIAHELFSWLSYLSGLVIENFGDLYRALAHYVQQHTGKILLALILTVPITLWIIKSKGTALSHPTNHRKFAIVLAVFLGWLGAHRFYLGQVGWGIIYLIIFYVFAPLAIVLGFIDAVRYVFMSDDDFAPLSR